ncbi:MAG: hypothetical protein AAF393_09600 [Pseudomonadota bacterium]
MALKGNLDFDPRGLIYESYRMEGISEKECRTIFLDWALGTRLGEDMGAMLQGFMTEYGNAAPDHPMTTVIQEGIDRAAQPAGRRGGAAGRR